MLNKLFISFDYDKCLSEPNIQKIAKKVVSLGHEVFVLTSRNDGIKRLDYIAEWGSNECVFKDAEEVGIKPHHICFTNQNDKYKYLIGTKIQIHVDDDRSTFVNINRNTKVKCFDCTLKSFEQDLMEYIEATQNF